MYHRGGKKEKANEAVVNNRDGCSTARVCFFYFFS